MNKLEHACIKLGEIVESVSDTSKFDKDKVIFLNTSDVFDGKILVENYTNIDELPGQAKKTFQNNDILFSEIRPLNKRFCFVQGISNVDDYIASTKLMVIRVMDEEKYCPKYIYYFLTSKSTLKILDNIARRTSATFPQITFSDLKELKLLDYPVSYQRKIVNYLSNLDNQIELNNKINQELEEMAQTLYNYWFIQFEFPNEEGKPYKASGGKMVWNEELKREIPAGWEVKMLGDECSTFLGGTPSRKKPEYWNGDINWINSGALNDSRIFKSSEKVTEEGVENSATKLLPSGTTVISITGNIMTSLLEIEACTNQSVVGVVENENMPKEFVYFMCKNNKRYYESLMSGAVQQHINKEIIDNTKFIAPCDEVMQKYKLMAEPLFDEIKNNNQQNQELVQLRDFMLPLLMNGQVTIED